MINKDPTVYNVGLTEHIKQPSVRKMPDDHPINPNLKQNNPYAPVNPHIDIRNLPIRGGNDNIPVTYDPKTGMLFTRDHDVSRAELESYLKKMDSRFETMRLAFNEQYDNFSKEVKENLKNVTTFVEVEAHTLPNPGKLGVIYITYEMHGTTKVYKGTYILDPSKGFGTYVQICEVHNITVIKGGNAFNG